MSRALLLLTLALLPCCGSRADSRDDETVPGLTDSVEPADAGADARPPEQPELDMWCCDLRNDRGERLNYMCSTALDIEYSEGRGYRCWVVR